MGFQGRTVLAVLEERRAWSRIDWKHRGREGRPAWPSC